MSLTFEILQRILLLERNQGYQNRAVIGGLDDFAVHWQAQMATPDQGDSARHAGDPALIHPLSLVLERLTHYANLQTMDERASVVEEILNVVADQKRVHRTQPDAHMADAASSTVSLGSVSLDSPVTELQGIGKTRAEQLGRLGVVTIRDLLYLFPRRYNDFKLMKPIRDLQYRDAATVAGTIWETKAHRRRGNQDVVTSIIGDGTGTVQATWFNQPYLIRTLRAGRQVVISGKVDEYLGRLVFSSPEWEILTRELVHTGGIIPVHPLTRGISARGMRNQVKRAADYWTLRLPDHLPTDVRERTGLCPLDRAIRQIHFPESQETLAQARRRLAFDELFTMQLGMLHQRHLWRVRTGRPLRLDERVLEAFLDSLPFDLTDAQSRVLKEILADVQRPEPMNRLLQGDVGSGKTVVALAAMLQAVAGGCQTALMAPTGILAEQHHLTVCRFLARMDGLKPSVALLTGSLTATQKRAVYQSIEDGSVDLVIGTHALIQASVGFSNLGLAVVDEQHRFGVAQRADLRQKGHNPHLLVMSATPIPRSLALTLHGDLDISTIHKMPPGRKPITTRWLASHERERAYQFLRNQVAQGHQAFVICPLVEESEKIEARAAVEEHQRLSTRIFPDLRVGLLHGRMGTAEKDEVMRCFADGELDILVSTPVVEVGIDIANASVMLIEGADRFGLSQLHQFRGRVGRGEAPSYCLLLAESPTPEATERLKALEDSQDGFFLAEKDLKMRGPGEFFGLRQSGLPQLRLAQLSNVSLLETSRREARRVFQADPNLDSPENRLLHEWVSRTSPAWTASVD